MKKYRRLAEILFAIIVVALLFMLIPLTGAAGVCLLGPPLAWFALRDCVPEMCRERNMRQGDIVFLIAITLVCLISLPLSYLLDRVLIGSKVIDFESVALGGLALDAFPFVIFLGVLMTLLLVIGLTQRGDDSA